MFSSTGKIRTPATSLSLALALALGLMACAPAVFAAPPTASANAWDMAVDISVLGNAVLHLDHQNHASFSDQTNAATDSDTAVSFDSNTVTTSSLARLTTGDIDTSVQWSPGSTYYVAGAQASIANLSLGVVNATAASLLSVVAHQIVGTALIAGSCPPPVAQFNLVGVGPSVMDFIFDNGFDAQNLSPSSIVAVPGLAVDLQGTSLANIPTDPLANTPPLTIANPLGGTPLLSLALNEQTVGGNGVTSRSVATNAVDLQVNVLNVITASVILSHADASITCH